MKVRTNGARDSPLSSGETTVPCLSTCTSRGELADCVNISRDHLPFNTDDESFNASDQSEKSDKSVQSSQSVAPSCHSVESRASQHSNVFMENSVYNSHASLGGRVRPECQERQRDTSASERDTDTEAGSGSLGASSRQGSKDDRRMSDVMSMISPLCSAAPSAPRSPAPSWNWRDATPQCVFTYLSLSIHTTVHKPRADTHNTHARTHARTHRTHARIARTRARARARKHTHTNTNTQMAFYRTIAAIAVSPEVHMRAHV